jgi:hypothetical protein
MLWNPDVHDTLTDASWNEEHVRRRIREIVADAESAYSPDDFWPAHEWDAWRCPLPLMNVYVGASGVVWALDALRRRGYADSGLDLADAALRILERWRQRPDFVKSKGFPLPKPRESALLVGGSGVVTVAWRLAPSDELADDLHARVLANKDNDAVEVMWGSPGTMLAARAMHEWTGDERWADAWRECADVLLARRDADGLWPTKLYGNEYRGLTPPHGLVGNVDALLDGGSLLDDETRETLKRDTNAALARTAVRDDSLANWSQPESQGLDASKGHARVQWCAGAPGVVIATAEYLDEELLLAGAELTWRAGPFGEDKGPGICHGTAGNGYAFLKTFERTRDEQWLDRARRFAVHALAQLESRAPRYALFTGDVGVALFAADCIDAAARYPVTDAL